MAQYIKIDSNGAIKEIIDLSDGEFAEITEEKQYYIEDPGETINHVNMKWKKYDFQQNVFVDDIETQESEIFEQKREAAISLLAEKKRKKISEGCPWRDYVVQIDPESLIMLNGTVLLSTLPNGWTEGVWKMANQEFASLTAEDLMEMAKAVGSYINNIYLLEAQILNQLKNATTESELEFLF